jgi:hypothetical protein
VEKFRRVLASSAVRVYKRGPEMITSTWAMWVYLAAELYRESGDGVVATFILKGGGQPALEIRETNTQE